MRAIHIGLFLVCFSIANIDTADPKPAKGGNHVVCYYTNWSGGRDEPYNFMPENLDPFLCTHIIYAFATFGMNYNLAALNPDFDEKKRGFTRILRLKRRNKNLKIMLGTGGWREGSLGFAEITANDTSRKQFARNAVSFLRGYNFDGMDLNWQHPTFREGSTSQDKENYVYLAQTIREEFEKDAAQSKKPRLLLAISITQSMKALPGYDIRSFNTYMDFISVLCYDYVFSFKTDVKHHAPLYAIPGSEDEDDLKLNINYTINFFLEQADPEKLVLGIPTYGRTYTLEDPDQRQLGSYADGAGTAGPYTKENGFLAYFEICSKIKNENWTVEQTKPGYVGPYAYKGNQWVGYDDIEMVKTKARYAKERGLAGVVFWTVDYDDFLGKCHGNTFPLINAAKNELSGISQREETVMLFPSEPTVPREMPKIRARPPAPNPTPLLISPAATADTLQTPAANPSVPNPTPLLITRPTPATLQNPAKMVCPTNPPATPAPTTRPPPRQMDSRSDGGVYDPETNLVGELLTLIERAGGMKRFCKVLREAKSTFKSKEQSYNLIDKENGDNSMVVDVPNLKPLMFIISNSSISIQELNIYGKP